MKKFITSRGTSIYPLVAGRSNVWAVKSENGTVLVDSGMKGSRKKILRAMASLGIEWHEVTALVLTHSHFDHMGNAFFLQERTGCSVIAHQKEVEWLASGDTPLVEGTTLFSRFMLFLGIRLLKINTRYSPITSVISVDDQYDLRPHGIEGYCMHTPGHSQGSMTLIVDDEYAIAGDTVFNIFPFRVFPPFAEDTYALMMSWRKLLNTTCRFFLPAHGKPVTREQLNTQYKSRITKKM